MKKFWLVTLTTGIICILAGLMLAAVLALGFSEELVKHADEFSINEENYFELFGYDKFSGVTRVGTHYSEEDTDATYYFAVPEGETITGMDFEIAVGQVQIRTGDTMAVEVTGMFENAISSHVENGVWYIDDSLIGSGSVHTDYCPEIMITVPKDLNPDFMEFYLAAGMMEADNLHAKDMQLEVDAGSVKVFYLMSENSAMIKNGAGEVMVYDAKVNNLIINEGLGRISVMGKITGHSEVNGGVGEVTLTLTDRDEVDFDYKVVCGIGDVIIGGMKFGGDAETSGSGRGNKDYFELNCGIGRVEIILAGN